MASKLDLFAKDSLSEEKLIESFQGWNAYAKWADSYRLRKRVASAMNELIKIKSRL